MDNGYAALKREYKAQISILEDVDEVILFGRSVLLPVMEIALAELGISARQRVFNQKAFMDGGALDPGLRRAIILCGMRQSTRVSMREDAESLFPEIPCFDFFAVYFRWLTDCVRRDCDYCTLAETLLTVRGEHTIHNIDSINTSYCNLKCKECSNGVQYRKKKKHVSLERHIQSLDALTKLLPISYCNLQGGEPFLNPELAKCLYAHAGNGRIAFFSLATNGTIVPKDEVMQALRDTGTMLRISDYGELSSKKGELIKKAAQFSVPCDTYQRSVNWLSYGELRPHGRTEAENRAIGESCHFGVKDLMLYDGRLYCCCRTLFADARGVDVDAVGINTLDLMNPISLTELEGIVFGRNLYRMCDYCDYPMAIVSPAEQEIPDTLIEKA